MTVVLQDGIVRIRVASRLGTTGASAMLIEIAEFEETLETKEESGSTFVGSDMIVDRLDGIVIALSNVARHS